MITTQLNCTFGFIKKKHTMDIDREFDGGDQI